MKLRFIFPLIAVLFLCTSGSIASKQKANPDKDKLILYILKSLLTRGHFVKKNIDDSFSEKVYTNFLNALDPGKKYFTQKDLKIFSKYKYQIDDQLKKADISFYNLVYSRFLQKIEAAKITYANLLTYPFDYDKKETINIDYEKVPFAKDEREIVDYWRKQLKFKVINKIEFLKEKDRDKQKEKKSKNVKKSSKNNFVLKSFTEYEKEARKKVLEDYNKFYERIDELENADWYSSFLNVVVGIFDPHTTYMSPQIKTSFDQSMSGKLEGIGARLQKDGVYTKIVNLISGGPAWKQGELEAGDIIMKVAQAKGESVDIVGMRLDKAIKFIKGKKGTEVRLTIKKKVDGSIKVISIIRDVVELEETFVKSSIVQKKGKKYGIINLPKFYIDFNDSRRRTATTDMEKEIEYLKKEGVEGIIVDLRNNGGGSLKTAIEIGGLFIEKGPIVQVKYRDKNPVVKNDVEPKMQWRGPLVVMVNEMSASASEIFAAAMQDYGRAVVIGSKQTYGKGTVQNIVPLNYYVKKYNGGDLGALKLTIQKFYRINGGSTQIEGVYSDIVIPNRYTYMDFGERDLDGALPWSNVSKTDYAKLNFYSNFTSVVENSKQRILTNPKFTFINQYAKWLKFRQSHNTYSLNYKTFVKQEEEKDKEVKKYKDVYKYNSKLDFKSPKYEALLFKKDTLLKEKRDRWHKNLKKDIYLNEALNVLSELKIDRNLAFKK